MLIALKKIVLRTELEANYNNLSMHEFASKEIDAAETFLFRNALMDNISCLNQFFLLVMT